jgi:tetratricopeptide (TPR) repeat protein
MDSQSAPAASGWLSFWGWFEVNKRRVLIGGAIALVVGLIAAFFVYTESQKEIRASEALSEVRSSYNPSQPSPPGLADAYFKIAKDYSGTKASARAALMGASALFVDGNYAAAQQKFEQYIREYPESPWLAQAHFGIAASLDAQKKYAEAASKYEEIRRRYPNDAVADETKLALGRVYESQNKPEDAYKLYEELAKASQYGGGIAQEAGLRLADLEEKYPQLVKTNVPPPTTPMLNPNPMKSLQISNRPTAGVTNVIRRVLTNSGAQPGTVPQSSPAPAAGAPKSTSPTPPATK